MTPAERRRLAGILGMLGSEFAGERASAALQAEAFRKRHGMTWEEMLALPAVEVVVEPVPDPAMAAQQAQWAAEDAARKARWAAPRTVSKTRRARSFAYRVSRKPPRTVILSVSLTAGSKTIRSSCAMASPPFCSWRSRGRFYGFSYSCGDFVLSSLFCIAENTPASDLSAPFRAIRLSRPGFIASE